MRRLVIYLLVAALSFFAGLLVHKLWCVPNSDSNPSSNIKAPLTVSFCELERDPRRYDGKLVRVRAELYRDAEPFIYDWSCRSANVNRLSPIYLEDLDKVNITVTTQLTVKSYQPYVVTDGDVIAVGVFEADRFVPNDASNVPHLRIILKSVALFQE